MKRIFSLATTALTIKSLWWDKLSPEDRRRYTEKAQDFYQKNKHVIADKGRAFYQARKDAKAPPGFYKQKKTPTSNLTKEDSYPGI